MANNNVMFFFPKGRFTHLIFYSDEGKLDQIVLKIFLMFLYYLTGTFYMM